MGIAADIAIIVVAALVGGLIAQILRQPLIVGYVLAGIAVGPFTGGVAVSNIEDITRLAEIGVALLLFTLGIQFSLKDLRPVLKVAVLGTPIQVLLTIVWGAGLGYLLDMDVMTALWFGAAIAPSNTMIVLKTLDARGLIGTLSSRVMIGVLIVQDLFVMALMLVVPHIGDLQAGLVGLGSVFAGAVFFLGVMYLLGMHVIPRLMRYVARMNSREFFFLTVTALGLGIAYAAYLVGLSFAFGAFLAGLVLSESDYSYQALSDVTPLRDLFALIFFVSIGMLLDPAYLFGNLVTVLWVVVLVALGKMLTFGVIVYAFGYRNVTPIAVSLALFQLGEFSFVLAREGLNVDALGAETYSLILTVALSTMLLTPPAFQVVQPLYRLQKRWLRRESFRPINVSEGELHGHVVLAGAGRVGLYVAQVLRRLDLHAVSIELSQRQVDMCRDNGLPVIYGDASQSLVLQAAHVQDAALALVTTPSIAVTRGIVQEIRRLNPNLHIVARAESTEQMQVLHELGVYEVVQPQFEAGLEIARQALLHLDIPAPDIQRYADAVRRDLYAPLYDLHERYRDLASLQTAQRLVELTWLTLPQGSPVAGKSIGDAQLRSRTGATIVAILRGEVLLPNPGPTDLLEEEDRLALLGERHQINTVAHLLSEPGSSGAAALD